jgi:pimeloyl-ACP methyl ester carboxylesterase
MALASGPAHARDVDIGGLAATFLRAGGTRPAPGAVIIAGSGPTDRDGNSRLGLNTNSYKLLAEALGARGISSVRYDKRGVGGSAKLAALERETTVQHFVSDAAAVAQWLATQPDITSVVLIGHSEGGLIALLAAETLKPAGIVLLAAPGRRLGALLREQFARPGIPAPSVAEARGIIAALERGEDVADVSKSLAPAFRPSVQPYLRSLMAIDPVGLARSLPLPLMIIGGGRDLQVGRSDFDALVAGRPDAVAYWEPDMGHTLKPMRLDPRSLKQAYTDPNLALVAGLTDRIADFILRAKR